ncbi:gliding motility-associated C-terminal domain-containing protein [Owenweeksia hongkongensis]|uniref:gliding motility-associated C-terminal domain-containing protein n=1 Tax=Owenweeksia hongkongensis TaxID=253245 RepID=UPI003A90116A
MFRVITFCVSFLLAAVNLQAEDFCVPVINWSKSVSFCQGNSITLNAYNPNSTYIWSTNANTSSISVNTSGTYWVTVTNSCGSTSDTIQVYVDQFVNVNLGADRAVCSSSNPKLTVPYSPSSTYKWQDNSTSNEINITQSGQYHVKVTNSCGTYSDTVNITLHNPAVINLGPDQNYCVPGSHTLSIPNNTTGNVVWSNSSTAKSISVNSNGKYWVKVTNSCGVFTDTVRITYEKGTTLDIGDTIGKCNNVSYSLLANVTGGSYLWSTNATSQGIIVNNPGTYWVKYTDNCGTYYDTAYVVNLGMASVDLGPDTLICVGEQIELDAGGSGSFYSWNTGATSRKITVDSTGTYFVSSNNGCGPVWDTINVEVLRLPGDTIGDSAFFCMGGFIDVNAGLWGHGSYYYWDDGSSGRFHTYSTPGAHWVDVGNYCDTIRVHFYVKEMLHVPFDLGNDTALCAPMLLETGLSEVRNRFFWSDGTDENKLQITSSDTYWVEVTNACGVFTDTIKIEMLFPPQIIASSKVICNGVPVVLDAIPDTLTVYQWNTGSTSQSIVADTVGWYKLYAYNKCDTVRDSVLIREQSDIVFDLGNDTVFCEPHQLVLNVGNLGADSIRWSTGSKNGVLPISTSGTYWVTLYNSCGEYKDTINVQILSRPGGKVADKAFCIGDTAVLNAYEPMVTAYRWNTGATSSSIIVDTTGWYYVDLQSACGWTRDSIHVQVDEPIPPFDLGNDTIFCKGFIWLDPGYIPGATYTWQDFTNSRQHIASSSGKYYVTVSNTCDSRSDTINVLITGPPVYVLGDTVRFCTGSTLTLNAQNPGSTYLWNDGSTSQQLSTDSTGLYWVTIENLCGKLTDTVQLITDKPLDSLELGNDTSICRGEVLTLKTGYPGPGITTLWSTGATGSQIQVNQTGDYWVVISNTCGSWEDTIHVEVLDIPVYSLGPDTVICAIDGRVDLFGPPNMVTYQWSSGASSQNFTATKAGTYWLTVNNGCFSYTDSIFLKEEYPIDIDLGPDTVLCFGESLFLTPGNVGYKLHWNNNFSGSVKEVTRSGEHWVWAKNSCGLFSDTIQVWFDLPVDAYPIDTTVCDDDEAVFDFTGTRFTVEWFDGSRELVRSFAEEGTYSALLTNTCGTFPKDFEVNIVDCDCPLYVPNTFTPDGDGVNDEFLIGYDCQLTSFEIRIFNRWGEVIYESDNSHLKWDGKVSGKHVPMGTYSYIIDYSWSVYDETHQAQIKDVLFIIK